ncbi:S8 family serine peptidase [Jidongwangia harbinensis]|uniref:S8 family serine peptidase n=1 Tax=Jidongwangia harbinensis TaxID=2878561 RepID=UPI001CDA15A0|nr:S8 family serine peptidase [Jidongwangia harbinensis]MCA2216136.1 S8 family serine peptidase [Jidongwangia harbinensis]
MTGDRVTVSGSAGARPSIVPGKGREGMSFSTSVVGGRLMVIPGDAARLIRTGKIDRRLFDVTELIRSGYADEKRTAVPLIVSYRSAAPVKRAIGRVGARVTRELPAVRGGAVSVPKSRTQGLWKSLTAEAGVRKIWLDGLSRQALDVSVPQIGAPAGWAAGHTGKGMTVAVLDSAVDAEHPDLAGRVTVRNFVEDEPPAGGEAHGTHVAATIAGDGKASGGRHRGVAPEAKILSGVVCGQGDCPDSAILAGMQWAAVERKARVVNMSLRQPDKPGEGPLEEAVNRLTAETGALFVICAGNAGRTGDGTSTVEAASTADAALSVGAVDDKDQLADFSSRGPRVGDAAIKPDITAPGVGIVAAKASSVTGAPAQPGVPDGYLSMSGTSMAAPHVAGAALLLAQAHPDWTASRLKATLMASAQPDEALGAFEQGAGRVDVTRALGQTVVADPPSVSYGLAKWPHTKDVEIARKLTYRNDGEQAVTLKLAITGSGAGVFGLGADTIEVPAGGTAAVPVTVKLPKAAENTAHTARVIAAAGDQRVVTPLAIVKETERYDITVHNIGLDGKPTPDYFLMIFDDPSSFFPMGMPYDESGTVTVRVPRGRYTLTSDIDTSPGRDLSQTALMYQPTLVADRDAEVTFDARRATPVSQRIPEPGAEVGHASAGMTMKIDGTPAEFAVRQQGFDGLRIGEVGARVGVTDVIGSVTSRWTRPGSEEDSPYAYFVVDRMPGDQLLAGYHRRYTEQEFATETQDVRAPAAGLKASQLVQAAPESRPGTDPVEDFYATSDIEVGIRAGSADRINHYSIDDDLRWRTVLQIGEMNDSGFLRGPEFEQPWRDYRAGEHTKQVWAQAPFGPSINGELSTRLGDDLFVSLPQLGDAAGHRGLHFDLPTRTKLFRDGELIADEERAEVGANRQPAEAADYRVEQTSEGGFGGLAIRTATVLTFRSARPAGDTEEPLPLVTVHFGAPAAGKLPVDVRDVAGKPTPAAELDVEVSFDDGKTWKPASVSGGAVPVDTPAGTEFVSLRARAKSAQGSTVEQTVIRAYRPE